MTSHNCELCDTDGNSVAFCTACNFSLCDDCWNVYPPHRKGLLGPHGLPHEKANPAVVQDLKNCMDEPNDDNELRLHQEDEETTWFGLERDDGGTPVLAEYRRYAAIMMQTSGQSAEKRYPSLVSFIGQTGAGKSSLIKLLIDLKAESTPDNEMTGRSAPVIGRSASAVPTSADVHLYLSPDTTASREPILYADCEGFNGGEQNPVAVDANMPADPVVDKKSAKKVPRFIAMQKVSQGTKRLLKWASRDSPAYEETSKRGYTVSEMYPRIFYAFSDVIVFVVENPKTLEVVVERMLEWADANYSRSINQPVKPHAVIVLNKSNTKTPEDQWDHINATAHLLNTANARIDDNRTFSKYTKMWKKRSASRIDSMHDLLRCYYATVHVVRIPEKSRYQLLNRQRQELHKVITECCTMSFRDKQERELLTDTDEFGLYLSLAFDHFSETLDEPFNFVEASLKRRPLSTGLADDLLTFVRYFAQFKSLEGQISTLFKRLTPFVASCILLEAARKQRMGRPEDWFGEFESGNNDLYWWRHSASTIPAAAKPNTYRDMCRRTILRYFDLYVPCGFVSRNKNGCEIRRKYHSSYHMTRNFWGGETCDPGHFVSKVSTNELHDWEEQVLGQLIDMHHDLKRSTATTFQQVVVQAHQALLVELYTIERRPGARFQLNSMCAACLFNPAQHELQCGHILCSRCARDFGTATNNKITILDCPLHGDEPTYPRGATIQMAPAHSGLRVLTLDGGGVRGIVELSVLKAIQDFLGIELQDCFDLVVGTSTGGIIALGFGHHGWDIDNCIQKFRELVYPIFTKRSLQFVNGIRRVQMLVKHSKYETRPLEAALKDAFTSDTKLFPAKLGDGRIKTAITAASGSGSNAWVFSNYATMPGHEGRGPKYTRYRPNHPPHELFSWEAARGTSAAPGFFKPFMLKRDELRIEEWVDGGLLHNNPVEVALEEVRRIAETESLNPTPDIVLSVGTGLTKHKGKFGDFVENLSDEPPSLKTSWLKNIFTMVSYQIKLNLDTDRRWERVEGSNKELAGRMYRINPDLGMDPPELDDVGEVSALAKYVPAQLAKDLVTDRKIRQISATLVSSLFYFERAGAPTNVTSSSTGLPGRVRCRISGDKLPRIADFLSLSTRPELIIHNSHKDGDDVYIPLPMAEFQNKTFEGLNVNITISSDDVSTTIALRLPGICSGKSEFPISGFPRRLLKLDFGMG